MLQVAGEGGDSGEGWSEGDEGSVDGLAREVYTGYTNSPFTSANHPAYFDTSVPMYEAFQVSTALSCSQTSISSSFLISVWLLAHVLLVSCRIEFSWFPEQ